MYWRGVCDALTGIVDSSVIFERLREEAGRLRALPDLLVDSGLPEVTMNHPRIALRHLEQRLNEWGLQ